jgi:L-alanine-DL-glutamate epimerase-like enolase superfamily enzyme
VVVEASGGGDVGVGYSYTHRSAAALIADKLVGLSRGQDVMAVPALWSAMRGTLRNIGTRGIGGCAISAVDAALWDLKARVLGLPLVQLLGRVRESVPIYGSGGFTSYGIDRLQEQLGGWAADGLRMVKMKVGRRPTDDPARLEAAREAVGPDVELLVDANGAYSVKQAVTQAELFARHGVTWLEEPLSSDDLAGLRWVRERMPSPVAVAAGEYGHEPVYFRRMLEAQAVDVLQADVTRCLGISGLLQINALCEAHDRPLSAHTSPALHCHVAAALGRLVHLEYFWDHVRVERLLFDGVTEPCGGQLVPDVSRPGNGLSLKHSDVEHYRV